MDCFHHGRGSTVLTGVDSFFGYRLTSPAHNAFVKTSICGLKQYALSTVMVFNAVLLLPKELISEPVKWTLAHGFF